MKNLLFTMLFLLSSNLFAAEQSCTCATMFRDDVYAENSRISNQYQLNGGYGLKLGNDAEFLEGTNKDEVIILIHGFIASPFEVKSLAKDLNDYGYSVYMPLLYGFGAYGETANQGKLSIWRSQIKKAVSDLSKCFKRVTLGGMSLGAALATDYYLTTKDKNISSLVLLSPYFDISQSVAKLLIGPLSTVKESFGLSLLHTISQSDDLVEIVKNRKYYSDIMPFMTLQELFRLSDEIIAKRANARSNVPVMVAYSEHDTTIDLSLVTELPRRHFINVSSIVLAKTLKVPHQIAFESSNPRYKDMSNKIRRFIWTSNLQASIKSLK